MSLESLQQIEQELALPDSELAVNALTRQITSVEAEAKAAWGDTDSPKVPLSVLGPEPSDRGSLDHSDWLAEGHSINEANEFDAEEYAYATETYLDHLIETKEEVENGDEGAIKYVATKERERLAKEAEGARLVQLNNDRNNNRVSHQ